MTGKNWRFPRHDKTHHYFPELSNRYIYSVLFTVLPVLVLVLQLKLGLYFKID